MNQIKVGHYEGDGGLIYLPLGFVPDFFLLIDYTTNPIIYVWFERMEDDEATSSLEGLIIAGGSTAFTKSADAGGILAYDSGSQIPTITEWSTGATVVAKTTTAHGTYYKGTSTGTDKDGRAVDRDAIFECVASTTTGATEPVWPSIIGDDSASDNGVIWRKVDVAKLRGGYKGVRIAAGIQGDSREMYCLAIQADSSEDWGDVVGWTGGIYGA